MIKVGLFIQLVLLTAADDSLVIEPSRLVVEHGSRASANCSSKRRPTGIGWEASEGQVDMTTGVQFLTWTVEKLTQWDIKPLCYANFETEQETVPLPVTVYKSPDSVSISFRKHTGAVMEGTVYTLQCDIKNVAPVQNLTVNWYKHQSVLDQATFTNSTKTPVSTSADLQIKPSRTDDGETFRCKATLELGPDGPQPPPTVTSDPLSITVHYKPEFSNHTETIKQTGNVILNCTVTSQPPPVYTWSLGDLNLNHSSSVYSSSSLRSGNYTCTAANSLGSAKKLFIVEGKNGAPPGVTVMNALVILAAVLSVVVVE
ncbi:cell adhesion molecule 4-like [Trichomycterus rosablanca]|uniref:cell adhesion molecule 4-like n=1 Tax=Trichomycterus rosablanca TaxID=2290929 RepID=UPI002F35880A